MENNKNLKVVLLISAIALLAVIAVAISVNLNQAPQAPTDTSAESTLRLVGNQTDDPNTCNGAVKWLAATNEVEIVQDLTGQSANLYQCGRFNISNRCKDNLLQTYLSANLGIGQRIRLDPNYCGTQYLELSAKDSIGQPLCYVAVESANTNCTPKLPVSSTTAGPTQAPYTPTSYAVPSQTTTGSTTTVTGPELTVTETATPTCSATFAGGNRITYTVVVRNLTANAISYTQITNNVQDVGSTIVFNQPSNGGTLAGNTVTWPAGTVAAGGQWTASFSIELTKDQVGLINSVVRYLNNTVVAYYSDSRTTVFQDKSAMLGCSGNLPATGLREDMMYVLAVMFMLLGIIVYRRGWGQELIFQKAFTLYDNLPLVRRRGSRSLEKSLLEK